MASRPSGKCPRRVTYTGRPASHMFFKRGLSYGCIPQKRPRAKMSAPLGPMDSEERRGNSPNCRNRPWNPSSLRLERACNVSTVRDGDALKDPRRGRRVPAEAHRRLRWHRSRGRGHTVAARGHEGNRNASMVLSPVARGQDAVPDEVQRPLVSGAGTPRGGGCSNPPLPRGQCRGRTCPTLRRRRGCLPRCAASA